MSQPATFEAELWRWQGDAAWHFVSLPEDVADTIEFAAEADGLTRGFGSVRVEVTVGATTWRTSLFPDAERGTYILPVKRAVRDAEGLVEGGPVPVSLTPLPAEG